MITQPTSALNAKCNKLTKNNQKCQNNVIKGKDVCRHHIKKYDKPKWCPICMESLFQVSKPLECGHWVHFSCLEKFVKGNQESKFADGCLPIVNIECPICKATLNDIKIDSPTFQIFVTQEVLIESIQKFLKNKMPIDLFFFQYLVSYFPTIKDKEMLVISYEIAWTIANIIMSCLNTDSVKKYIKKNLKLTVPRHIVSNQNSELNIVYNILTDINRELVVYYQL